MRCRCAPWRWPRSRSSQRACAAATPRSAAIASTRSSTIRSTLAPQSHPRPQGLRGSLEMVRLHPDRCRRPCGNPARVSRQPHHLESPRLAPRQRHHRRRRQHGNHHFQGIVSPPAGTALPRRTRRSRVQRRRPQRPRCAEDRQSFTRTRRRQSRSHRRRGTRPSKSPPARKPASIGASRRSRKARPPSA